MRTNLTLLRQHSQELRMELEAIAQRNAKGELSPAAIQDRVRAAWEQARHIERLSERVA